MREERRLMMFKLIASTIAGAALAGIAGGALAQNFDESR